MKIYCRKCGVATDYSIKMPSFCCGCGKPLNASAARMGKQPKPEPEPEEEISADLPQISKLDVDIDVYASRVKFGDIVGTKGQGFERDVPSDSQRDSMKSEFFKEAGGKQSPKT